MSLEEILCLFVRYCLFGALRELGYRLRSRGFSQSESATVTPFAEPFAPAQGSRTLKIGWVHIPLVYSGEQAMTKTEGVT